MYRGDNKKKKKKENINNPKCCRNTKTLSLATQLSKSLNGIPHFQTATADPTVHLICLHVLPLRLAPSLLLLFLPSSLPGLVFLGHLFLASAAARTSAAPAPRRTSEGCRHGGWRGGRMEGGRTENKRVEWRGRGGAALLNRTATVKRVKDGNMEVVRRVLHPVL